MPFLCKIGDKFNHSFVLAGIKVADGKVTTRKNGNRAFTNKKNSKCGAVPRYYIPIAPYISWINAVLNNKDKGWKGKTSSSLV